MGTEIERKFLLRDESWRAFADEGRAIEQFYLAVREGLSVRLRILDGREARLTVKIGLGLRRGEYEYEVPVADAREMAEARIGRPIAKRRHRVPLAGGLAVEIDVFGGELAPLVLAEIELPDETHEVALPAFLGREVTGDGRYTNAALALGVTLPPTV